MCYIKNQHLYFKNNIKHYLCTQLKIQQTTININMAKKYICGLTARNKIGCDKATFLKLVENGVIEAKRTETGSWQVSSKSVDQYIAKHQNSPIYKEFTNKVAIITGGANGIGKCIADEFRTNGATVYIIDKQEGEHFIGDISDKEVLEKFVAKILSKHNKVNYIINNALPLMKGIDECTYEEFQYALSVGITAPFYLVKLLKPYLGEGASIINISSSRDRMSQPQTESYTAAKGGIAALTHALAVSLSGRARVNSISPGWIDTAYTVYKGSDAIQQPAGRVGNPIDIANMVLFLCSNKASFITGENICIDGGMTKQMIYHGDNGWKLNK